MFKMSIPTCNSILLKIICPPKIFFMALGKKVWSLYCLLLTIWDILKIIIVEKIQPDTIYLIDIIISK